MKIISDEMLFLNSTLSIVCGPRENPLFPLGSAWNASEHTNKTEVPIICSCSNACNDYDKLHSQLVSKVFYNY